MASIFIFSGELRIYHGATEARRKTSLGGPSWFGLGFSLCLCASVVKSFFRRVRPFLIPLTEQELPVAGGVALVTQHGESVSECAQKLVAVAFLHLLGFAARLWRSLPFINGRRNIDRG